MTFYTVSCFSEICTVYIFDHLVILYCLHIWPLSNKVDRLCTSPSFLISCIPALTATTKGIPSNMTIYFIPCFFSSENCWHFWSHFLTVNSYEWLLCNILFFVTTIDYYERFLILDVKKFLFEPFSLIFSYILIWWSVI